MNLRKKKDKRLRRRGKYNLHIEVTSVEGLTKQKCEALEKKIFTAINDLGLMGLVGKTSVIEHNSVYVPNHLRISGVLNDNR